MNADLMPPAGFRFYFEQSSLMEALQNAVARQRRLSIARDAHAPGAEFPDGLVNEALFP